MRLIIPMIPIVGGIIGGIIAIIISIPAHIVEHYVGYGTTQGNIAFVLTLLFTIGIIILLRIYYYDKFNS